MNHELGHELTRDILTRTRRHQIPATFGLGVLADTVRVTFDVFMPIVTRNEIADAFKKRYPGGQDHLNGYFGSGPRHLGNRRRPDLFDNWLYCVQVGSARLEVPHFKPHICGPGFHAHSTAHEFWICDRCRRPLTKTAAREHGLLPERHVRRLTA